MAERKGTIIIQFPDDRSYGLLSGDPPNDFYWEFNPDNDEPEKKSSKAKKTSVKPQALNAQKPSPVSKPADVADYQFGISPDINKIETPSELPEADEETPEEDTDDDWFEVEARGVVTVPDNLELSIESEGSDLNIVVEKMNSSLIGLTCKNLKPGQFKSFSSFKKLRHLNFEKSEVDKNCLEDISKCKHLESLDLSFTSLSNSWLKNLLSLKKLKRLNLAGTKINARGIATLKELPLLESLGLYYIDLKDDDLKTISELSQLKQLNICGLKITDAGLEHIAKLRKLELLNVSETEVTDGGLTHLSSLRNLKSLEMEECLIEGDGLFRLPTTLLELDLESNKGEVSLHQLERLVSLRALNLTDSRVKKGSLTSLSKFRHLKTLTASGINFDPNFQLPSTLACLELDESNFSDSHAGTLKSLTQLTFLNLSWTNITDKFLSELGSLESLEFIDLTACPITDAGLSHLKNLPNLEDIVARGTGATESGALKICEDSEKLEIDVEPLEEFEYRANAENLPALTDKQREFIKEVLNYEPSLLRGFELELTGKIALSREDFRDIKDLIYAKLNEDDKYLEARKYLEIDRYTTINDLVLDLDDLEESLELEKTPDSLEISLKEPTKISNVKIVVIVTALSLLISLLLALSNH